MTLAKAAYRVCVRLAPAIALSALASQLIAAESGTQPTEALAPYFVPAGIAPVSPDKDGFIQRWMLLEPIAKPNRTNTVFTGSYVREALTAEHFPGQFGNVPRAGTTVKVAGTELAWHALDSTLFDVKLFNFAQSLGKTKYGVIFYAATVVHSPRDMTGVRLAVGSNSASMWWVNGQEAAGLYDDRRMVMDDVLSRPLTLKKGANVIWGAVINGPGLSDFCVRFVDTTGKPVTDLTVDVR